IIIGQDTTTTAVETPTSTAIIVENSAVLAHDLEEKEVIIDTDMEAKSIEENNDERAKKQQEELEKNEAEKNIPGPSTQQYPPRISVKRHLEKSSDSDLESMDARKENVGGPTSISGGENVSLEVDVPWIVRNWNKNKKR
ncbi:hypothetical protein PS6_011933, partial [Mucor atramentarius]